MSFSVDKEALEGALGLVKRAVGETNLMVTNYIYLEADKSAGKLKLRGTNNVVYLATEIDAEPDSSWSICVPANLFTGFVEPLPPGQKVFFSFTKENISLGLSNGETNRFSKRVSNLKGIHADDFPAMPQFSVSTAIKISNATLSESIKKVSFAAAKNRPDLPALTGVAASFYTDRVIFAGCDSLRLSLQRHKFEQPFQEEKRFGLIIPKNESVILSAMLPELGEELTVGTTEQHTMFIVKDDITTVVINTIAGAYPNVLSFITKNWTVRATLNTYNLTSAIKSAVHYTRNEGKDAVLLILKNDALVVYANAVDQGDFTTEVPIEKLEGQPTYFILNVKYLRDALYSITSPSITIEHEEGKSQVFIKPVQQDGVTDDHILMLMRMKDKLLEAEAAA